jgi:hypothetical protein
MVADPNAATNNGTDGKAKKPAKRTLNTQIQDQFDAIIRQYCESNKVDRSDLIRSSVATTIRNAGLDVPDSVIVMAGRGTGSGKQRGPSKKVLAAKATAADQMMAFMEQAGMGDLLAQFQQFMANAQATQEAPAAS